MRMSEAEGQPRCAAELASPPGNLKVSPFRSGSITLSICFEIIRLDLAEMSGVVIRTGIAHTSSRRPNE
jgi:hypothetical protein